MQASEDVKQASDRRARQGVSLVIDNEVVIDNDGQHAPVSKDGSIRLSAGEHTIGRGRRSARR